MKYKWTIFLLLAVAIAGVVAYSLSRKPTSEELGRQRKRLLPDLKTDDVRSLTIEAAGLRLVCRRESKGEWRVAEPVAVPADRGRVGDIVDKFQLAEKVSSVYAEKGKPLDLAQYGLKEPARKVAIEVSGAPARTWTILIGNEAGVADSVFVAVEGQPGVFAVRNDIAQKAAVTLTDLRAKSLAAPIGTFELGKLAVAATELNQRPAFDLECEKSAEKWELKKPFYGPADSDKVTAVANKLYEHRIGADDFVVDDPAKAADYGLDRPALTLTLEGAGKTQTVLFSRRQEGDAVRCYALQKGELAIVRVPDALLNDLRKQPDDLRERALARFTTEDVAHLAVAGPNVKLDMKKDGEDWRIEGDKPAAADNDAVESFLRSLREARVQAFAADDPESLDPYGLSDAQRTLVTLKDADGAGLCEIALGGADDSGDAVYALRNPYPAVLSLKKESYLDSIGKGRLSFLDRVVVREPEADAIEMSVDGKAGRFRCVWDEKDARWNLVEPVQGAADEVAVQSIVGQFAHLRAESFATEKADDLAPYGLKEPETTVTVSYRAAAPKEPQAGQAQELSAPRVRVLYVAAAQPPAEGSYARLADDERVFTLPDYVVGQLRADLASKEICASVGLVALTFHKSDEMLRFAYDSAKLHWADAELKPLPEATARAVESAARLMESFTAPSVAAYVSKGPQAYGFDKPYLTVELEEKATKGKQIVIGRETDSGDRYAKGPSTSFVHVAAKADVEKLAAVFAPAPAAAETLAPGEAPAPEGPAPQ